MACASLVTSRRRGPVGGASHSVGVHVELAAWACCGQNDVTWRGTVQMGTRHGRQRGNLGHGESRRRRARSERCSGHGQLRCVVFALGCAAFMR
jgi:hypothetical protein